MSIVGPNNPLYDLVFAAASDTLLTFGRNKLGGWLGMTAVLLRVIPVRDDAVYSLQTLQDRIGTTDRAGLWKE